jgi:hypothetical protein
VRRTATIALALVVLPGCGGGGGQSLTKEEYAAKADAICAKGREQQNSLGQPSTVKDLVTVADKTLTILDGAITDLSRLKPPASEKAISDQWLEQVRTLRNDLKEVREKAKNNDLKGLRQIAAASQEHNSRANALATELGMSVCNKD